MGKKKLKPKYSREKIKRSGTHIRPDNARGERVGGWVSRWGWGWGWGWGSVGVAGAHRKDR